MVEAKDDLTISIKGTEASPDLSFSGNGSEKYNCVNKLSQNFIYLSETWSAEHVYSSDFATQHLKRYRDFDGYVAKEQLEILKKYQSGISTFVYDILESTIILNGLNERGRLLSYEWPSYSKENRRVATYVLDHLSRQLDSLQKVKTLYVLQRSPCYPIALLYLTRLESMTTGKSSIDLIINSKNTDGFEQLITCALLSDFAITLPTEDRDRLNREALDLVTNEFYLKTLERLMRIKSVGSVAFNFSLPDVNGNIVQLSDFRGKVVFVDYWFSGCGFCKKYYTEVVKQVKSHFRSDNDVLFLSISIDRDQKEWKKSIKGGQFTSEDVVNLICPEGSQSKVIFRNNIKTYPHPQLIDKEGKLFSDSKEDLRLKGSKGLIAMINEAKKTRK